MNRQLISLVMAAVMIGVLLPSSPSRAETDVDTFGWVRAVYVAVGISSSSASFRRAITESQVRAVVERKLRAGGVPLVSRDEWAGHTDVGFVEVDITAVDVRAHPIYAVSTCLQLNLWLNRFGTTNRNEAAPGTTWQESSVVSIGRDAAREQGIGVLLDGHVDKFVAAWKAAHAK